MRFHLFIVFFFFFFLTFYFFISRREWGGGGREGGRGLAGRGEGDFSGILILHRLHEI